MTEAISHTELSAIFSRGVFVVRVRSFHVVVLLPLLLLPSLQGVDGFSV